MMGVYEILLTSPQTSSRAAFLEILTHLRLNTNGHSVADGLEKCEGTVGNFYF